ncbi:MAG: hypothetical protein SFW09_06175 [Hyphomicrobiaceae bacterium]|nr:hypothetical protein [Hyphomicrobiaceae bacterium]
MTDESAVDTAAAKVALDRALDAPDDLGPDGWNGLAKLADDLGDEPIIGLMKYSLGRSAEQVLDADRSAPEIDDNQPEEAGVPAETARPGQVTVTAGPECGEAV